MAYSRALNNRQHSKKPNLKLPNKNGEYFRTRHFLFLYDTFTRWWRERDSNPRYPFQNIHDFQSCSFDRSDISPQIGIYYLVDPLSFLGPRLGVKDLLNGFLGPTDLLPELNGRD